MASAFSGTAGRNQAVWSAGLLGDFAKVARQDLQQGLDNANPIYDQAAGAFGNYIDAYKGIPGALTDAYGLNGQAGTQAAQQRFQQGPGYQFQMDQGLTALQRQAAATGKLGSGNLTADSLKYSQGLADQGWQSYLTGLGGLGTQGLAASSGQASVLNNKAGAQVGVGQALAQNQMDVAGGMLGIGQAGFQAGQQASQNRMSALQGGLQLGAGLLGKLFGAM